MPAPTRQPEPASRQPLAQARAIDAVVAGERRLTPGEALRLYHEASLHDLGRWATAVANRLHGDQLRTYVIDRNINYTNICSANCTFCAFKRDLGEDDAYTLSMDQLHAKMQELSDIGGTQVLLQGGMHPELGIGFYEDMLRSLKSAFPHIAIHGFSPPEFVEFVAIFELDGFPTTAPGKSHTMGFETWRAKLEAIMRRLMDAGLDSIPGGGGEIFTPHVRKRIGLGKADETQWLEVMAMAHRLGMNTSATMMFGHVEGIADRIDHMRRVRDMQDRAIQGNWPGRYMAFISWPFQRENTPLGRLPEFDREASVREGGEPFPGDTMADALFEAYGNGESDALSDDALLEAIDAAQREHPKAGKVCRMAGASDYLRTQAISRLFLDNVHSIGSSWVTMGPRVGQIALFYGASDMGSVMMEENVVSAAGTTYCLDEATLCRLIRDAGFVPAQRGNRYDIVKQHNGEDSPDLQVKDWSQYRAKKLHIEGSDEEPADSAISLPIASN